MHKPLEKARVDADINVCSVTRILMFNQIKCVSWHMFASPGKAVIWYGWS